MVEKNKILESWVMVEHLSEGEFKDGKSMIRFDEMHNNDFYGYFKGKLGASSNSGKQKGLVVYVGIFKFIEVIKFLREKFKLQESFQDIQLGEKFSLAIFFNDRLEFLPDKTFFTASAYINTKQDFPYENKFKEFEAELKMKLSSKFENTSLNASKFNEAMGFVIENYGIELKKCRARVLGNVNTDAVNLHSFFIEDLETAKSIETDTLNGYLYGNSNNRVNLDSKSDSQNFNPTAFESILQPKNYPSGRFPTNTKYALSFMQQTAVNICLNDDNKPIKSVNGPPGTGKTTLLKDVFAELVVRQALDISNLKEHTLVAKNSETLGEIPEHITKNSIIVASSNNGAVQNIVNELPLVSAIDDDLIEELKEADYFFKLANSELKREFIENENGKINVTLSSKPCVGEEKFWGMFSLEGGRSDNITKIITAVQHIVSYLKNEYTPDSSIYATFLQQYNSLKAFKESVQKEATRHSKGGERPSFKESFLKKLSALRKPEPKQTSVNPLDMSVDYATLQLSNPWFTREFRIQQSRLFITALRVRKQFLYDNIQNLYKSTNIWEFQNKHLSEKELITTAWSWINMAIPVISSTFASFSRMCRNLQLQALGHLFVDEAGQALPQAGVGAVFRSRQVTVVGDPSQIQPVLTLDANILNMLCERYGVTKKYLSDDASVQTLCDSASSYGYYRNPEKSEDSWIGIPLWVHRRCDYPMFEISNKISYGGLMVKQDKAFGKTGWFDVKGQANNKYVEEQGEFLCAKISQMAEKNPDILDKNKKDIVYVITPFSNVAQQLAKKLNQIGFTRHNDNKKPTNVGTIHTFQGKEAPIVFMVLGADAQSKGSANWAVSIPNMMNVAVTRAKKEFYIVGDKNLYLHLNRDVINDTYEIIQRFGKEHPESFDCDVDSVMKSYVKQHQTVIPFTAKPQVKYIQGTVKFVGKGKNSNYAYIIGDDGKQYTLFENTFARLSPNVQKAVQSGARITFTADYKNYIKRIVE